MSRGRKRFWSDDEKREICLQTCAPGVSVARVARRYSVNANLIFKWLRDPRFSPKRSDVIEEETFLPVEIEAAATPLPTPPDCAVVEAPLSCSTSPVSATRIDITLSDGRRILVEGPTALSTVIGLVQGLVS